MIVLADVQNGLSVQQIMAVPNVAGEAVGDKKFFRPPSPRYDWTDASATGETGPQRREIQRGPTFACVAYRASAVWPLSDVEKSD